MARREKRSFLEKLEGKVKHTFEQTRRAVRTGKPSKTRECEETSSFQTFEAANDQSDLDATPKTPVYEGKLGSPETYVPTGHPTAIKVNVTETKEHLWAPYVCDSETNLVYTNKPAAIVHTHDGNKSCIGIVPDWTLSEKMQSSLLVHRKVKEATRAADAELSTLNEEYEALLAEAGPLDKKLASYGVPTKPEHMTETLPLRKRGQEVMNRIRFIEERKAHHKKRMDDMVYELTAEAEDMFDMLDDMFVTGNFVWPDRDAITGEVILPGTTESAENASTTRPSCVESMSTMSPPGAKIVQPTKSASVVAKEQEFRAQMRARAHAEREFWTLHKNFEEEERQHNAKVLADEAVSTCTDFNLRILAKLRELSQAMSRVEQEYQAAKKALLAAGVQPSIYGSSSGLLMKAEDEGKPRNAGEPEEIPNPARLESWLTELTHDQEDALAVNTVPEVPELDDWDVASVEMHESRSMVADGWHGARTKRRIENWRKMCGLAG